MGRMEEAREEFARLARIEPTPRRFDPDAYSHMNGARKLTAVSLGALRELYHFRDAQARKEDRPPFKVLSDSAMLEIAEAQPDTLRELERARGVSEYVLRRYGMSVLSAVKRGVAAPQTMFPASSNRDEVPLDNAARERLSKLKEWRKARAAKRGVETDVIVSNDVLQAIAKHNPRTLDALIQASDLTPWKAREYGEEMLRVLQGKRK